MLKKRFEEEALLVKEEKWKKVIDLHNRKVFLEDELENLYIVKDRVTGEKLTEEEMEKRTFWRSSTRWSTIDIG